MQSQVLEIELTQMAVHALLDPAKQWESSTIDLIVNAMDFVLRVERADSSILVLNETHAYHLDENFDQDRINGKSVVLAVLHETGTTKNRDGETNDHWGLAVVNIGDAIQRYLQLSVEG